MKIRIKGNSVRLRLTRSEVDQLASEGQVTETTDFGDSLFSYSLHAEEGINDLQAGFGMGAMTIRMAANTAKEWAKNETVGFSNSMALPNGSQLFLLVEKDFKCIDADVTEDQSDNFENPLISCE